MIFEVLHIFHVMLTDYKKIRFYISIRGPIILFSANFHTTAQQEESIFDIDSNYYFDGLYTRATLISENRFQLFFFLNTLEVYRGL